MSGPLTRPRAAAAALLLALLMLVGLAPAAAQTFPPFTGLVVDNANVLPADVRTSLTAKLQAFQQRTKRQLVVATIADMQGYPLEDYGYRLGRAWGVGLKDADNGAILFVAPNNPPGQRGPRIEVGRGLEPVLTDGLSRVIIETKMIPLLRAGNVPGAMSAGTDAIIEQLSLPDTDAAKRVQAAEAQFDATHRRAAANAGGGFTPAIGFVLIVIAVALIALRSRRARGARYMDDRGGGGGGMASHLPVILWGLSELGSHRGGGWGGGSGLGGGDDGGGPDGSWGGGGFTGGGGGDFGGGGASGNW